LNDIGHLITHVPELQTDQEIRSGESIRVRRVIIETIAGAPSTVVLEQASSPNSVIMRITMAGAGTQDVDAEFLADQGVRVTTPPDTTCTIIHSQGGA